MASIESTLKALIAENRDLDSIHSAIFGKRIQWCSFNIRLLCFMRLILVILNSDNCLFGLMELTAGSLSFRPTC